MSYSMCRFWAYDESKKLLGAGKDAPAWKLAAAGSMGASFSKLCQCVGSALMADCPGPSMRSWRYCGTSGTPEVSRLLSSAQAPDVRLIDAINAEIVMVRLQGDFAKPPEKRFNYKHCFDALFRVSVSSTQCAPHFVSRPLSTVLLLP